MLMEVQEDPEHQETHGNSSSGSAGGYPGAGIGGGGAGRWWS